MMNWKRTWKEVVVACLKYFKNMFLEGKHENISRHCKSRYRNSKLWPEYRASL